MENPNIKSQRTSNGVWGGGIIIAVGILALLANLDIDFPHWLFSWSSIMLLIGLAIGVKHNFRNSSWLVLVLIGGFFTLDDIFDIENFNRLIWPVVLISLGIFLILRPRKAKKRFAEFQGSEFTAAETVDHGLEADHRKATSEDFIDSVNVFGGSHQKVFSKNFQGGDIVAVFGGCDVDLSQAEFSKTVVIDITAIFGGAKIIVPPSWEVKSEISAIFGGVDDKRNIMPVAESTGKRIILKGVAMFGGVDIRNY